MVAGAHGVGCGGNAAAHGLMPPHALGPCRRAAGGCPMKGRRRRPIEPAVAQTLLRAQRALPSPRRPRAARRAPATAPAPARMPDCATCAPAKTTGGERGADGRAGAELRATGSEAVGDAGAKDAKAKQRQGGEDQRQRIVERGRIVAKALRELAEDGRADADDHGEDEHFHAAENDIAEHALGEEGRPAEQAERDQDEARERGQLELDQA